MLDRERRPVPIDFHQFALRLPAGMRERLRHDAAANRRSMNSQIVHYLDRALAAEKNEGPAEGTTSPSPVTTNPLERSA
jgi:hypothetical protein